MRKEREWEREREAEVMLCLNNKTIQERRKHYKQDKIRTVKTSETESVNWHVRLIWMIWFQGFQGSRDLICFLTSVLLSLLSLWPCDMYIFHIFKVLTMRHCIHDWDSWCMSALISLSPHFLSWQYCWLSDKGIIPLPNILNSKLFGLNKNKCLIIPCHKSGLMHTNSRTTPHPSDHSEDWPLSCYYTIWCTLQLTLVKSSEACQPCHRCPRYVSQHSRVRSGWHPSNASSRSCQRGDR